ncbi:asparagine synthase-related protein [Streptomyces uncialis]|uniref:asparagine synthase-related protein n=1 Tax=Streptomyces uncialis TaxID=1048205 RepID=UPI00386FD1C8|nr:asparagine synthase-related protein [Streptomyces uncialis]
MDFLILPDSEDAAALAQVRAQPGGSRDRNERRDPRVVRHASGRPWVVGHWDEDEIVTVSAGDRRIVLLGRARPAPGTLERLLETARSLHDVDSLARRLPGSCHLTASFEGRVRAQGTLSTARQIFHTRVSGVTVAAGDPARLAALAGRGVDEESLALRLLTPGPPWPLSLRTVWSGVAQSAPGHWLELTPGGECRAHRWWSVPEPVAPLSRSAGTVRSALRDAVGARARAGTAVSADLSGGMDSTSLCFLAAATGAELHTHHWQPLDLANDDALWWERSAAALPDARHRSVPADRRPTWFQTPPEHHAAGGGLLEGPLAWHRNHAQMEFVARAAAGAGARTHLMGVGGDELFSPSPTYLWSMVRGHPLTSLPDLNRMRLLNRWWLGPTVRGLLDSRPFAASLRAVADGLTDPLPHPREPSFGWGGVPRMPPWATGDAVATVRRLLGEAADARPGPMHRDRHQHQVIEGALVSGSALRQMNLALDGTGVTLEAPFLDDRVLEAALMVRTEDRVARGRYKPVLTAAMRGVVPAQLLGRRSKGEFSAEAYEGLLRNRRLLLERCDDLELARLGLVDAGALRAGLLGPKPETRDLTPFENTLSCEAWLRGPVRTAPAAALTAHPTGEPR